MNDEDQTDSEWSQQECEERRRLEEAFWASVDKSGDCWIWKGPRINAEGYGLIEFHGTKKAHRIAWELQNGQIPKGMLVCHRCDNPPCVRPSHLFLGTPRDNMRDMIEKGRQKYGFQTAPPRGEANHKAKLTAETVLKIRQEDPSLSSFALSEKYGVAHQTIRQIRLRQSWKHI